MVVMKKRAGVRHVDEIRAVTTGCKLRCCVFMAETIGRQESTAIIAVKMPRRNKNVSYHSLGIDSFSKNVDLLYEV
jgi:hypothetical protein